MANISYSTATDMSIAKFNFSGTLLSVSSGTHYRYTDGGVIQDVLGTDLTDDGTTLTGGTITQLDYSEFTIPFFSITGMTLDVATALSYSNDTQLLMYILGGADSITGSGFNDVLYGFAGNDTMSGGSDGYDKFYGGDGDDSLMGGNGYDTMDGGAGNDTLDGGGGADSMAGGAGDDTYVVNYSYDVVTEDATGGIDTVRTGIEWYTLGSFVENLVLTGTVAQGFGNSLNNYIVGNSAINSIDGMGGADTMEGGAGNDIYKVDDAGDVIVENADEGDDIVYMYNSNYTMAANVERLEIWGTFSFNQVTGNGLDNYIGGSGGSDTIDGAGGADTMDGWEGDDTYYVDNAGDVILDSNGYNNIYTSISYTLNSSFNGTLILTGVNHINGTGNGWDNHIIGNSGNNILDGGLNGDWMEGGEGNDTYIVDSGFDSVDENADEGIDTVSASLSFTLGTNVENLKLTGSFELYGTGNSLDNLLTGNAGISHLTGGAGNDTLEGGGGNDVLEGGTGSDTFVVDAGSVDWITDFTAGTGGDLIDLSVILGGLTNYVGGNPFESGHVRIAYVPGLALQVDSDGGGDSYVTVTTLESVNINDLTSDNFVGGYDPTLQPNSAPVGSVTISGTVAEDEWLQSANTIDDPDGGGTISYQWQISSNGTVWSDLAGVNATYNAFQLGHAQVGKYIRVVESYTDARGFDESVASAGTIAVVGVNHAPTLVNEIANQGATDTLAFSFTIPADSFADMDTDVGDVLTYSATLNDGSALPAWLGFDAATRNFSGTPATGDIGSLNIKVIATDSSSESISDVFMLTVGANHTISGSIGADTLSGTLGEAETLMGGLGDDVYLIDDTAHKVVENPGEGTDEIISTISYFVLPDNIEKFTIGSSANIWGVGNSLDNMLTGNDGFDTLEGGEGADTLYGGSASDTLIGGNGNDWLDGGLWADSMAGGAGNDIYILNSYLDVVTEEPSGGIDTIRIDSALPLWYTLPDYVENLVDIGTFNSQLIGNALGNYIVGNGAQNTLDGMVGADTLAGGGGNDNYMVDTAADVIIENSGEGEDTVYLTTGDYILPVNVENIHIWATLPVTHITGNASHNMMYAGDGIDHLAGAAGNDTLVGYGSDFLSGGAGNDTYEIDNAYTTVTEYSGKGIDTVKTINCDWTLGANFENLTLAGTASTRGTGNAVNNVITGNDNINIIDGGAGADKLIGRGGDDVYIVDNANDKVYEGAGKGIDTVQSSVSFVLSQNVENLTLTGTGNIGATGNGLDNRFVNGQGDNVFDGRGGSDTVIYDGTLPYSIALGVTVDLGIATAQNSGNGGVDTLISIENLTGTYYSDTLYGDAQDNVLDGRGNADDLTGRAGSDTYMVDNVGDVVVENAGGGNDTVIATASYTLAANVETLVLSGNGVIDGTGNALNNTLKGNSTTNVLDGGQGKDTVSYGVATWAVNVDLNLADYQNTGGGGLDKLVSIENITGSAFNDHLTGNAGNNVLNGSMGDDALSGGDGADTLNGGVGNDALTGGAGADRFQFNSVLDVAANVDSISDFTSGEDRIQLENAVFKTLGIKGVFGVDDVRFYAGSLAHDADDRILYDTSTGSLYYDADGSDVGTAVLIATITGAPVLAVTDISVV